MTYSQKVQAIINFFQLPTPNNLEKVITLLITNNLNLGIVPEANLDMIISTLSIPPYTG